jgi:hypothetical protein
MSAVTVEQIQAADHEFFETTAEAQPYRTEDTIGKIYAYIQAAWPEAALSVSARQIAFRDLLAKRQLKKISGWIPPVSDAQRELVANTPSYIASEKYKTNPEFREAFDLVANEEKERQDLLQWSRDYNAMDPEEAARRIVEEPGFEAAVQKLVDANLL